MVPREGGRNDDKVSIQRQPGNYGLHAAQPVKQTQNTYFERYNRYSETWMARNVCIRVTRARERIDRSVAVAAQQ